MPFSERGPYPRPDPTGDFWAVTSFFNPAGFRSRRRNFEQFRRALEIPLLVVELVPGSSAGELGSEDADVVLRVDGDPRIWQKERLLNLGIAALPSHARFVTWLDCDLVFLSPGWSARARALLAAHGGLVQPFRDVHHASVQASAGGAGARCLEMCRQGFAWAWQQGVLTGDDPLARLVTPSEDGAAPSPECIEQTRPEPGFAWAARREDLQRCPLYERNVIGGGDGLLAYAGVGRQDLIPKNWMSPAHTAHYVAWAKQVHRFWRAELHPLEGDLMHLPHGRLVDRDYVGRNRILIAHGYDPRIDVVAAPGEGLRWASHRESLAEELQAYFMRRREDG